MYIQHIPLRDTPNFSAALGKSPRSTIPNDKSLFEYLLHEHAGYCQMQFITIVFLETAGSKTLVKWGQNPWFAQ